jgi:hypothetical protein
MCIYVFKFSTYVSSIPSSRNPPILQSDSFSLERGNFARLNCVKSGRVGFLVISGNTPVDFEKYVFSFFLDCLKFTFVHIHVMCRLYQDHPFACYNFLELSGKCFWPRHPSLRPVYTFSTVASLKSNRSNETIPLNANIPVKNFDNTN